MWRRRAPTYSVRPMPANVRRGNVAFTVAYSMAAASQHTQAAWELLSYLTGRDGMRVWLKTRDKEDPLAQFYVIEFRMRDEQLEITCFESSLIINPDHVTSPPWMGQAATIARRIINPESIGVSP